MKQIISFRFLYLAFFLILTSFNNATSTASDKNNLVEDVTSANELKKVSSSMSTVLYEKANLQNAGLSLEALEAAVKGYEKLVEEGTITNSKYLAIVDLSQSSRKKRFYLLNIETQELALNTFVAHGKNSGVDQAVRFSNRPQ